MEFSTCIDLLVQLHATEIQGLRAKVQELSEVHDIEVRLLRAEIAKLSGEDCTNKPTPKPTLISPVELPKDVEVDVTHAETEPFDLEIVSAAPRMVRANGHSMLLVDTPNLLRSGARSMSLVLDTETDRPLPKSAGDLPASFSIDFDDDDDQADSPRQTAASKNWSVIVQQLMFGCVKFRLREGWAVRVSTDNESSMTHTFGMSKTIADLSLLEPSKYAFEEMRKSGSSCPLHKQMLLDRQVFEQTVINLNHFEKGSRTSHSYLNFARSATCTLVMHPSSRIRIFWVFSCLALLMVEIFLVTLAPFGIGEAAWAKSLDLFSATFWTVDIPVNFLSGIYVHGVAETRFSQIARTYVGGWFIFDLCIAAVQWISIIDITVGRIGTTAFLLKAVRFARFLRLVKVASWVQVEEIAMSALGPMAFRFLRGMVFSSKVTKFLFASALFVHCLTCAWYEVGQVRDGWVSRYAHNLKGDVGHDYLVSLHWTLTQFQGNIEIHPGSSTIERLYACIASGVCIVCLALFLGSLTELLVSISEERKRRDYEVRLMYGFLHRHAMPPALLARANHYLRQRGREHALFLKESTDEKALSLFPSPMRGEMRAELHANVFCCSAVFMYLKEFHANVCRDLCEYAITNRTVTPEEDLFIKGAIATHMYVILAGEVVYHAKLLDVLRAYTHVYLGKKPEVPDSETSSNSSPESLESDDAFQFGAARGRFSDHRLRVACFSRKDIVNEAALWMAFQHEGDLHSPNHAHCLLLSGEALIECVAPRTLPFSTLKGYAGRFLDAVIKLKSCSYEEIYLDLVDTKMILARHSNMSSSAQGSFISLTPSLQSTPK